MTDPEMMLLAALKYARRGWTVFPAPPGQKKSFKSAAHSGGRKWGATCDLAEIKEDFGGKWPDANIGLPCGSEPGFWVLEADTHAGHGVDGIAALKGLEERHGRLPPTLMAMSPSGSVHYYFKWIPGVVIKNSASRVAPGVDVRGQGGMVVAPPSSRTDGDYRWLNDLPLAEPPQWLIAACAEASRRPTPTSTRSTQVDMPRLKLALTVLPNPDLGWDDWNNIAMALWSATGGSKEGLDLLHMWSKKSTKYTEAGTEEKWTKLHATPPTSIGAGTIFFKASEACPGWDRLSVEDFYAYSPQHNYIYIVSRDHWPAASVNARLPKQPIYDANGNPILDSNGKPKKIKAATWLDQNRSVDQMTWAPGHPQLIRDKAVVEGWVEKRGALTFNRYCAPNIIKGDALRAGPWLDHCDKVLGTSRKHVVSWLGHRVQKPEEKINHAIVLGGAPGIGKDTLLEPVKRAVGAWNFAEASPAKMLGNFNASYLQAVILRISEARDLGDVNRYALYEHMKVFTAAPPDVIKVNEKFIAEYTIFNVVGIVYTTNYKHGGLYLPSDDRRHYVHWSDITSADFDVGYWDELWDWYETGGDTYVASYLSELDISAFNPKEAPPRTEAFWEIVHANDAPEDAELADIIDTLGNPTALTVPQIKAKAGGFGTTFESWINDSRNSRAIPHRLEKCGYVIVRNPDATDGNWRVDKKRTPIYAKRELSIRDQIEAARACRTRIEAASAGGPRVARG